MSLQSAALLALVLTAGCATSKSSVMEALQNAVEGYNEAFRWKNYDRASSFMPPDLRAAFLATYEDDDNTLQVDDYQITKVDLIDETTATVTVRLRYMQLPSVTVDKTNLVQHWKRIDGTWILETEDNALREIKADPSPSKSTPDSDSSADPDPDAPWTGSDPTPDSQL